MNVPEYWACQANIEEKHLVVELNGLKLLIDSGSPMTFGEGEFEWDGNETVLEPIPITSIQSVSRFVGLTLDGIIGADLLYKRGLTIDLPNSEIRVHSERRNAPELMSASLNIGVPVVKLNMLGEVRSCVVDTGAMQTFISQELSSHLDRVGTIDEFLMSIGAFQTDLVQFNAVVQQDQKVLSAAVFPDILESTLGGFGISGIIGLDVLSMSSFEFCMEQGFVAPEIGLL